MKTVAHRYQGGLSDLFGEEVKPESLRTKAKRAKGNLGSNEPKAKSKRKNQEPDTSKEQEGLIVKHFPCSPLAQSHAKYVIFSNVSPNVHICPWRGLGPVFGNSAILNTGK